MLKVRKCRIHSTGNILNVTEHIDHLGIYMLRRFNVLSGRYDGEVEDVIELLDDNGKVTAVYNVYPSLDGRTLKEYRVIKDKRIKAR